VLPFNAPELVRDSSTSTAETEAERASLGSSHLGSQDSNLDSPKIGANRTMPTNTKTDASAHSTIKKGKKKTSKKLTKNQRKKEAAAATLFVCGIQIGQGTVEDSTFIDGKYVDTDEEGYQNDPAKEPKSSISFTTSRA
ncbi:unnamed protein product, partial [Amoebophrya sp. A120]